jgi:phosphatidylglycerol:prolipoprotein diacylglycerol transferase
VIGYYLHNLDPVIFRLWGDFGPRWYGLAYALAFFSALVVMTWTAKRRYLELPPSRVGDFVTWGALLGVLLGGRLGYVFFYHPEMLLDPLSIVRVWEGGMSSHGGIFGLIAVTFYYSWRHNIGWTNLGDNVVVSAPLGLFFGRCANFINGELYGRITNVPWAMQFPKELLEDPNSVEADRALAACRQIDPSIVSPEDIIHALRHNPQIAAALRGIIMPRHPSQLYEAFLEGVVLFTILWLVRTRMRQPNGVLTGLFFACYGIFRIFAECYREPDAPMIGAFTRGQFFSFFLVAIGAAFIWFAKRTPEYAPALQHRD